MAISHAGSGDPSATPNSVILLHKSPDSGSFVIIRTYTFCIIMMITLFTRTYWVAIICWLTFGEGRT